MPTARLNNPLRERVLALLKDKFLPDRAWDGAAVHRSDLIFCLRKAFYRYTAPKAETERLMLTFLRGRILHEMLVVGEGEFEVVANGITMHVDDMVDGQFLEKKTTMMKFHEPPIFVETDKKTGKQELNVPHWLLELAYAAAHHPERKANFLVMHLMGDYGAHRLPLFSGPWEYEFTKKECDAALKWFEGRRLILTEAMESGTAPSVKTRLPDGWECKECPYATRCETELMKPGNEPTPIPILEVS